MFKWKKVLACTLAATTVMGTAAMAGCSSKGGSSAKGTEEIQADDLWYDSKKIILDPQYDMTELQQVESMDPIIVGDRIYVPVSGIKNFTLDDMKDKDFDYNTLIFNDIVEFDLDGKVVKKTPLNAVLTSDKKELAQVSTIIEDKGKLTIFYTLVNANTQAQTPMVATFDPDEGKISESRKLEGIDGGIISRIEPHGDYLVLSLLVISSADYSQHIAFFKDGKVVSNIDLSKVTGEAYGFGNMKAIDDTKFQITIYGQKNQLAIVDAETGKVELSKETPDEEMIDNSIEGKDGKSYYIGKDGIKEDDKDPNTEDPMAIGLENCNVNYNDMFDAKLIEAGGDRFIFSYNDYRGNFTNLNRGMYILNKASSNPNAGKKAIDAAIIGDYIMHEAAEGIRIFNESNKDYFVRLRFYDKGDTDVKLTEDQDQNHVAMSKANASVANELAVDLLAGTGPDVLLDVSGMGELLTEEYLEDLNKYIDGENGLKKDDYFTNIFESSEVEGKLYNLPLSFSVGGILTEKANVADGKIGFTFEEYKEFVDKVCNGKDPMSDRTKLEYFSDCFDAMNDLWLKDGKVQYDQEAFKALSEYVKDYVTESPEVENADENGVIAMMGMGGEDSPAFASILSNFNVFSEMKKPGAEMGLYGIPSFDGRGPSVEVEASAAISSKSENKEGAWELLKVMAGEEASKGSDANSVNRNACKANVESAYQTSVQQYEMLKKMGYNDAMMGSMGMRAPDEKVKDEYMDILLSATNTSRTDASIEGIITEEIQAYLAGQKDIDSVIKTIQDRAQTVYDERK